MVGRERLYESSIIGEVEHRNLLQPKSLNLVKIMNEKISKKRIQIRDLQKQEIEEK